VIAQEKAFDLILNLEKVLIASFEVLIVDQVLNLEKILALDLETVLSLEKILALDQVLNLEKILVLDLQTVLTRETILALDQILSLEKILSLGLDLEVLFFDLVLIPTSEEAVPQDRDHEVDLVGANHIDYQGDIHKVALAEKQH
jgi:hypothetical protein